MSKDRDIRRWRDKYASVAGSLEQAMRHNRTLKDWLCSIATGPVGSGDREEERLLMVDVVVEDFKTHPLDTEQMAAHRVAGELRRIPGSVLVRIDKVRGEAWAAIAKPVTHVEYSEHWCGAGGLSFYDPTRQVRELYSAGSLERGSYVMR